MNTTNFQSDSQTILQEVCIEPSNFPDGVPKQITVTYQNRFPYKYIYFRVDENGNYCYRLIVGAFARKKKKVTPCPTICIVIARTTPCSGDRQLIGTITVGSSNEALIQASGGTEPYTYTISAGSLPNGYTLTVDTITGIATTVGTFDFTVKATDANGCTGFQEFQYIVIP